MLKVTPILNKLLEKYGYTSQQAFATKIGVPQKTINNFDKSVQHKSTTLFAVARGLGVSIEELFIVEEVDESVSEETNNG